MRYLRCVVYVLALSLVMITGAKAAEKNRPANHGKTGNGASDSASKRTVDSLYRLGAVPIKELKEIAGMLELKNFKDDEHGDLLGGKGMRVGKHGWLFPSMAPLFLTENDLKRFQLPKKALTPDEYVAMLDVSAYVKSGKNPHVFTMMLFALREMIRRRIDIQDKRPILAVAEARIGLEEEALRYLERKKLLTGSDFMALDQAKRDLKLLEFIPAGKPEDKKYTGYLLKNSNDKALGAYERFLFHRTLARSDAKYSKTMLQYLRDSIDQESEWWKRLIMTGELLRDLKDSASEKCLAGLLANDPALEVRERILRELIKEKHLGAMLDVGISLANGGGKPCKGSMSTSRPNRALFDVLKPYLTMAQKVKVNDAPKSQKISKAIDAIESSRKKRR